MEISQMTGYFGNFPKTQAVGKFPRYPDIWEVPQIPNIWETPQIPKGIWVDPERSVSIVELIWCVNHIIFFLFLIIVNDDPSLTTVNNDPLLRIVQRPFLDKIHFLVWKPLDKRKGHKIFRLFILIKKFHFRQHS